MESENQKLAPVTEVAEKAVPAESEVDVVEKKEPVVEKEVVVSPTEVEENENAQVEAVVVAPKEPKPTTTTEAEPAPTSTAKQVEEVKEDAKETETAMNDEGEEKPSVLAKMTSFLHKNKHSTAAAPATGETQPKADEPDVPKHRFITSMQGHGYPVTPIPNETTTTKPAKRGLSLTALFKSATTTKDKPSGEAHKEEVHTETHKEEAPSVPAYRFISTMQGHGYPVAPMTTTPTTTTTAATPAVATPPPKKTSLMGTLFKSKPKKHEEAPVKEERENMSRSHGSLVAEKTAMSVENVSVTVPEYRFLSTMQGHGYPVPPIPVTTTTTTTSAHPTTATSNPTPQSPATKKGRRGLMHTLLSLFRRDGKKKSKSAEQLSHNNTDHNDAPTTPPVPAA